MMIRILVVVVLALVAADRPADHPRRTPVVEAVQRTRPSIVQIRQHRPSKDDRTLGAGVVVDAPGRRVLTNRHVIEHAGSEAFVALSDGTQCAVEAITFYGLAQDLALLRIRVPKGHALIALPIGHSVDVMAGETVIVVGHPYGFGYSVSTGVVSALGREITMPGGVTLTGLVQTDAACNPGNSGGPLLNINGELIGLLVALRGEGSQGIAFAISADAIRSALANDLPPGKK